ncbi:MAG: hypothetical protein U1E86_28795 [Burkholderiaceae bacterium]
MVEVDEIDAINIYQADLLAMRRASRALPVVPNHLLIDSRRILECTIQQTCVDDGCDRLHRSRGVDRGQGPPRPADARARRLLPRATASRRTRATPLPRT